MQVDEYNGCKMVVVCGVYLKVDCECETVGLAADEKKMVDTVFSNAIDSLSDEDKKLPQVCYYYYYYYYYCYYYCY